MNAMHCSASRVAQRRGVLTNTFPQYQAKQEVLHAEADQEASLKPFGTVIVGRMWDKFWKIPI